MVCDATRAEERAIPKLRNAWSRLPDGVRRTVGLRTARRRLATRRHVTEHNGRLSAGAPTLTFYPMWPQPRAQIVGMLALLGVRIGNDLRGGGPQIAWDTATGLADADAARLAAGAINRGCRDTSKSHVDALWSSVAGYSVSVDPLVTAGPIVVKSEENGRHDGRVVEGPLRRRKQGVVYQRNIDATVGDVFLQTRPVVMGGRVPLVLEFHMPRPHWRGDALRSLPRQPNELYSAAETKQLLAFAGVIGLDYGELDVLRESATGRLFVIDANPTPVRPHFMAPADETAAMRTMADAFAEVFEDARNMAAG